MRTASERTRGVRSNEAQKGIMTKKRYVAIEIIVPVTLLSARREEALRKKAVWE
jgi:hypothetical protein